MNSLKYFVDKEVVNPPPSTVAVQTYHLPTVASGLTSPVEIEEDTVVSAHQQQQDTRPSSSSWKNYVIGALSGALVTLCFVLLYTSKGWHVVVAFACGTHPLCISFGLPRRK